MASILQEYGSRVGLKLAVNRVPADGYWSTHWMKHPLGFGNTNPRATADLVFSLFYKSSTDWNESGWRNPRFDQLLLAARGEADEDRQVISFEDLELDEDVALLGRALHARGPAHAVTSSSAARNAARWVPPSRCGMLLVKHRTFS